MFWENRQLIKTDRGQSAVEYLVFFAAIAILTLLSLCTFYPRVHQAGEEAFQQAVNEIVK